MPDKDTPAQPAISNSDESRELLRYLREESAAIRTSVREDAEANRKLLLDTVKFVSIPVSVLLVLAAFLGVRSLSDLKQSIQAEARRESQSEITKLQAEVRERLSEQFQTPTLQKLVKEAAAESTRAAAEPLIKSEVAAQVKVRVDAERPTITAAVNKQTQSAVNQMSSELDSLAKKAVAEKITTDVDPVIQGIKSEADLQLLITRMNSDDADAFDSLMQPSVSSDPSRAKVVVAALRSAFAAHNSGMFQTRSFNSTQTDDQLVAHLSDVDPLARQAALDTLMSKQISSLLPKIVTLMRSDPSINVRCSAYRVFDRWTKQAFQCLDSKSALTWWESNKQSLH